MVRAYDENGNVVNCSQCKFYDRDDLSCRNIKNRNRGSGDEYCFSIDYIGIDEKLLKPEQCDNWFCADFEAKVTECTEHINNIRTLAIDECIEKMVEELEDFDIDEICISHVREVLKELKEV